MHARVRTDVRVAKQVCERAGACGRGQLGRRWWLVCASAKCARAFARVCVCARLGELGPIRMYAHASMHGL